MAAAVRLVSERGTTALPVRDLAEAADVSRQLVYLQFGDRDALLVEAAADLVRRELLPEIGDEPDRHARALLLARHFAGHRPFYRAMLTGSCAFAMTRALNHLFGAIDQDLVPELFGGVADGDQETTRDLAAFIAGGTGAVVNDWLIDGEDPLDPEDLAHRLSRLGSALTRALAPPPDGGHR
jgi:AcrR family transcriptional regulator